MIDDFSLIEDVLHEDGTGMGLLTKILGVLLDEFADLHIMEMVKFSEMLNLAQDTFDIFLRISSQKNIIIVSSFSIVGVVGVEP